MTRAVRRLLVLLGLVQHDRRRWHVRVTAPGGLTVVEVHGYATFSDGLLAVCLTGEVEDVIVTGWYLTRDVVIDP